MPNTYILNPNPAVIPAEPFTLNGYFPLYYTSQAASAASLFNSFHSHELNGITYYMPDSQPGQAPSQYHGNYPGGGSIPFALQLADRLSTGLAEVDINADQHVIYNTFQTVPSINQQDLDDIIQPEFDHFLVPDQPDLLVSANALFYVKDSTNLDDMHDLYIRKGPQNLTSADGQISDVFAVFYIEYGVAKPIPNYKTLEVMLVELGQTYDAIRTATPDDLSIYDFVLEGSYLSNNTDSATEFAARSMPDRSPEWNYSIRYRSDYRPVAPFVRDPGDYIRPLASLIGATGLNTYTTISSLPVQNIYYEKAFQDQTYREKMRDRFEGQMVVLDWPAQSAGWDDDLIANFTNIQSDDLVNNLRMMVHGHWKQVTDPLVIKKFAYLNNFTLQNYGLITPDPLVGVVGADGRYGQTGLINVLCEQGAIQIIRSLLPEGGIDPNFSDTAQELEPVWNEFPHILTTDGGSDPGDDGNPGVDIGEFDRYVDNESNGYDMFNNSILQPYEPRGSIKYYPEVRYDALTQQAIQQNQLNAVRAQIDDILPAIVSTVESIKLAYDSNTDTELNKVDRLFDFNGPLYKVWTSVSDWKLKRKKPNNIVNIETHKNMFECLSRSQNARSRLSDAQMENVTDNYRWGRLVKRKNLIGSYSSNATNSVVGSPMENAATTFANDIQILQNTNIGVLGPLLGPINVPNILSVSQAPASAPQYSLSGPAEDAAFNNNGSVKNYIDNQGTYKLSKEIVKKVMRYKNYVDGMIFNEIKDRYYTYRKGAAFMDQWIGTIYEVATALSVKLNQLDVALQTATTPAGMIEIYNALIIMRNILQNTQSSGILYMPFVFQSDYRQYVENNLMLQYRSCQFIRQVLFENNSGHKFFFKWNNDSAANVRDNVTSGANLQFNNYIRTV